MTAPNPNAVIPADERHNVAVGTQGFDPKNAAELMSMAKFIAASELKPQGLRTASDCFLVMAIGMSYGFDPIMSLQTLHVVKGRVGLPGETCAALIQSHPQCRDFRTWFEGEGLERTACVQSWRKGRPQANEVVRFSMADAKRAGLSGENWQKYPDDMALWKAVARDKRRNWPDVYPRLQVVEDMDDPATARVSAAMTAEVVGPDPLLAQLEAGETRTVDVSGSAQGEPVTLAVEGEEPRGPDTVSDALPEIPLGLRKEIERRVTRLIPTAQEMAHEHIGALVQEMMLQGAKHAAIATAIRDWKLPS